MSRKLILITLATALILWLGYRAVTYKESEFKKVELKLNGNVVYNSSRAEFLDSIVYTGLDHLNIHGVNVVLRPLNKYVAQKDHDLKAHIVATDYNYIIFTGKYTRKESITILAHELIHLQQYHSGRLIVKDNNITWQGQTSPIETWMNVSYQNRPWEQEAFKEQEDVALFINTVLFK